MRFFDSVMEAVVLGEVAVGVLYLDFRALRFQTVEESSAHDFHEGGVIRLVAGFAQCDEIIRGVPTCCATFEVMDVQNRILRFAKAVTALVTVPKEDVFADVPEAELIALLILGACNGLILDLVLNARSRPAFVLAVNTVVKTWRAKLRLSASAGTVQRLPGGEQVNNICSKFDF